MENNGFDNTQPIRQDADDAIPHANDGNSTPEETSNDILDQSEENLSGLEETMPNPVESDFDRPLSGQEELPGSLDSQETMPTPVEAAGKGIETSEPEDQILSSDTVPTHISAGVGEKSASNTSPSPEKASATISNDDSPGETKPRSARMAGKHKYSWLVFPVLGLLALGIIAMLSGLGGYFSGISLRQDAENTQIALALQEQFQLGVQEMEKGEYHRAQQRFEYVIKLDPNYPGVTEKLSEVLLQLNSTATSTLIPTATITPTPDTRGNQELYDQSQQYLLNKDWKNTIETALQLRKTDPTFRTVDVDGMLFLALRNQGVDKILKEADLEGGIYDLTLASKFGPLDAEAQGFLNWTGLYITGASFWDIDWEQAVNYFSQVAPQLPNLRDGSGMTATERLRIAYYEYGNVLAQQGQSCQALSMYKQSLAIAVDPLVEEAAALAEKSCGGGGESQPAKTPKSGKKTPAP